MSNFKIGEKVVSLKSFDYTDFDIKNGVKHPKKGDILTIRTIEFDNGEIAFRFEEIINPILGYNFGNDWNELHYVSYRFRKIDYEFAENLIKEISESFNQKHLQN